MKSKKDFMPPTVLIKTGKTRQHCTEERNLGIDYNSRGKISSLLLIIHKLYKDFSLSSWELSAPLEPSLHKMSLIRGSNLIILGELITDYSVVIYLVVSLRPRSYGRDTRAIYCFQNNGFSWKLIGALKIVSLESRSGFSFFAKTFLSYTSKILHN